LIIPTIVYSTGFIKELRKLPAHLIKVASRKELLFRQNPLHPSIRLHALRGNLEGLWSISLTGSYRIIFERKENGDILFISIGKHDIYKSL